MATLKLHFDRYERPLVSVEVKPGLLHQRHFITSPPNTVPSVVVDFLIDTGANECLIDEKLISSWRLPKHNPILVLSAADPSGVAGYRYELSLKLHASYQPDDWYHGTWPVAAVDDGRFDGTDFQGIIGMDLLKLGSLTYVGSKRTCELAWT
jgi:hypothetical protein